MDLTTKLDEKAANQASDMKSRVIRSLTSIPHVPEPCTSKESGSSSLNLAKSSDRVFKGYEVSTRSKNHS